MFTLLEPDEMNLLNLHYKAFNMEYLMHVLNALGVCANIKIYYIIHKAAYTSIVFSMFIKLFEIHAK